MRLSNRRRNRAARRSATPDGRECVRRRKKLQGNAREPEESRHRELVPLARAACDSRPTFLRARPRRVIFPDVTVDAVGNFSHRADGKNGFSLVAKRTKGRVYFETVRQKSRDRRANASISICASRLVTTWDKRKRGASQSRSRREERASNYIPSRSIEGRGGTD